MYRAAAFAQALNDWCLVSAQEWERGYVLRARGSAAATSHGVKMGRKR